MCASTPSSSRNSRDSASEGLSPVPSFRREFPHQPEGAFGLFWHARIFPSLSMMAARRQHRPILLLPPPSEENKGLKRKSAGEVVSPRSNSVELRLTELLELL